MNRYSDYEPQERPRPLARLRLAAVLRTRAPGHLEPAQVRPGRPNQPAVRPLVGFGGRAVDGVPLGDVDDERPLWLETAGERLRDGQPVTVGRGQSLPGVAVSLTIPVPPSVSNAMSTSVTDISRPVAF